LLDQASEDFYCLVLMQATHVRAWTADDLMLLRGLADQLSLAVRNARLFDAMQSTALELQSKNAELEAFVYTVSHDLQAPVVSLRGFASLLQTRYSAHLDARGLTYITRIAANAEFLAKMLQDLLELSRVGRLREPDEDIATDGVIESVIHDLAAAMARRNVALQLPPVWPVVRYSRTHLRQVFSNLMSNAIKFMGPQAEPRVELGWRRLELEGAELADDPRATARRVEFFVRDNGIGIHPDYHERIFGAFQRLKVIDVEGTGVGLSIVKRIVELHGGAVRVDSAPNAGSAFYFTAPEVVAEPTQALDPDQAHVQG
jgi:signal transduction histidine kinase